MEYGDVGLGTIGAAGVWTYWFRVCHERSLKLHLGNVAIMLLGGSGGLSR